MPISQSGTPDPLPVRAYHGACDTPSSKEIKHQDPLPYSRGDNGLYKSRAVIKSNTGRNNHITFNGCFNMESRPGPKRTLSDGIDSIIPQKCCFLDPNVKGLERV